MLKIFNLRLISRSVLSTITGLSLLSATVHSQEYCDELYYNECEEYVRPILLIGGGVAAGALIGMFVYRGFQNDYCSSYSTSYLTGSCVTSCEKLNFYFNFFISADCENLLRRAITPFVLLPDNRIIWGDEREIDINTDLNLGCISIEEPCSGIHSVGVRIKTDNTFAFVDGTLTVCVCSSFDGKITELTGTEIVTAEVGEAMHCCVEFAYCPDESSSCSQFSSTGSF